MLVLACDVPEPACRAKDNGGSLPNEGVPLAAAGPRFAETIERKDEWDEDNEPSEEPAVASNQTCLPESRVLPNGSRLSCGRLARPRKGVGRSPCPARGTTLRFP